MASAYRFRDEWLVRLVQGKGLVSQDQIEHWRADGKPFLSQEIMDAGVLTFEQLGDLIRDAFRIDSTDLTAPIADEITDLVPEKVVRRHYVLPIAADQRHVALAMANPLDEMAMQDVGSVTGRLVDPLFAPPANIERAALDDLNPDTIVFNLLKKFEGNASVEVVERESDIPQEEESSEGPRPPVVQLADNIIATAVRSHASDIHIEHDETSTLVRYRVDGMLKNILVLPRYVGAGPLVSRIKIMAGLDVSDRLRPQDGRAKLRVGKDLIGLRVSTLPARTGEKVVLRILNEKSIQTRLADLGFHPDVHTRFCAMLEKEQGVVLVTGPTGSGKTTTLYAALHHMQTEAINIVTVEDPIEYRLSGITQVQVNEKQGLTFAAVLRSVLRQDPDVVMVGEIRDHETAIIGMQAALTGHLVLSTLHTNDTVGAVTRLVDIGVESFKISSGLAGVTAQRLVRRVCSACAEPAAPADLPAAVRSAMQQLYGKVKHMKAVGCAQCNFTGYKGRLPLIELLEINGQLRDAIANGAGDEALRHTAVAAGALHSMEADALWHLMEGRTTLEQVQPFLQMEELKEEVAAAVHAAPAAAPAEVTSKVPKVLVAVADPIWQAVLAGALADCNYQITNVSTGTAALAEVARNAPDVLIIAANVPGLSAVQVMGGIRNTLKALQVSFIAVLEEENQELREVLTAAGAQEVLAPPIDTAQLRARVEALLARRQSWSTTAEVMHPHTPFSEPERIAALRKTGILDTPAEEKFDALTRSATEKFGVPMSVISLVDSDRQWFKSRQGVAKQETPREVAFCAHAINQQDVFVIEDAYLDARFAENELVNGEPRIRFYAGAPINVDGQNIGMFCVMDHEPRRLDEIQKAELKKLAALTKELFDSRKG